MIADDGGHGYFQWALSFAFSPSPPPLRLSLGASGSQGNPYTCVSDYQEKALGRLLGGDSVFYTRSYLDLLGFRLCLHMQSVCGFERQGSISEVVKMTKY